MLVAVAAAVSEMRVKFTDSDAELEPDESFEVVGKAEKLAVCCEVEVVVGAEVKTPKMLWNPNCVEDVAAVKRMESSTKYATRRFICYSAAGTEFQHQDKMKSGSSVMLQPQHSGFAE